jgi:hypothetical protein
MNEEWRPIAGYEGRYEVSDRGRIKSLTGLHGIRRDLIMKLYADKPYGYLRVRLKQRGIGHTFLVHQLVLIAFVGPRPAGMVSRHLDGNNIRNTPDNLVWGTQLENVHDSMAHGTFRVAPKRLGIAHHSTKLNEDQVLEIFSSTETTYVLAKRFNVKRGSISAIKKGKSWKWLTTPSSEFQNPTVSIE